MDSFLHLCLQGRWDASALVTARRLAEDSGLDWDGLERVLHADRLAGLVYHITRGQNLLPAALERRLSRAYHTCATRNALLLYRLSEALAGLAQAGVPVILLKGAALLHTVYDNVGLRYLYDLDLLIRRADIPVALAALAEQGYTPDQIETTRGATVTYESQMRLRKPGEVETIIELHWGLIDSPYYQAQPLDWVWQTARPVRVRDVPALAPGPEAQVLHLCAHLLLHHANQREKLRWLHDVAEVIYHDQARLDWGWLLTQAQAHDLVLPLQQALLQVAHEWHAPIPAPVLDELDSMRPSRAEVRVFTRLTALHRPSAHRFWADLMALSGWRRRLHFAASHLFPSPAYMRQRYAIPHPLLLPFYYPYRWLVGLRGAL